MLRLIAVLIFVVASSTHGLNVLIWNPTLGQSHVRFLGNIADVLANAGHNVTILAPILDPHVSMSEHTMAAHLIPYRSKYLNDEGLSKLEIKGETLWNTPAESRCVSMDDYEIIIKRYLEMCKGILEDDDFVALLRSLKFDVAIHEVYELSAVALLEIIGVKRSVVVSAAGLTPYIHDIAGFSPNPSFSPVFTSTFSDEMTFWERKINLLLELEMRYRFHFWEKELWSLFNGAFPGFLPLKDLLKNTCHIPVKWTLFNLDTILSKLDVFEIKLDIFPIKQKTGIVLLNVNEFTEPPRPTASIIRHIGGVAIREPQPLSREISAVLDERSQNVLFSFGTFAHSKDMPTWLKRDIISTFGSFLNTTFIWKYEEKIDADMLSNHSNIHVMKWVPQIDLLADKRVSLFITHAGMNSVLEATQFGKPMVAIPLFGDQFRNARTVERRGLAVLINRSDLNRGTLTAAIRKALSDSTIAHKAAKVASYLDGRPAAARYETAKWVRLVAEEGPMDHLILQSRDMSFIHCYNIDVFAYLLAQLILVLWLLHQVGRLIVSKVALLSKKRKVE